MELIKKYWKFIVPISLMLIILLVIVLFFSIPRVKYRYDNSSKSYLVESVYGNALTYRIDEKKNDVLVDTIGDRAFYSKNIKKIIFENPDSIYTIKRLAFSECKNLEEIDISKVKYIENSAFSYCENLEIKELNAKNIGMSAFYGCKKIKDVKLNEGLVSIGSYAFSKTSIETLNIPTTVSIIYNDAFSDMLELKTINVYSKKLSNSSKEYLSTLNNITINYL